MRYMMSEDWEDGERDIYSVKWYKGMYLEHRKVLNRAVAYENRFDGPLVCRTNERRSGRKTRANVKGWKSTFWEGLFAEVVSLAVSLLELESKRLMKLEVYLQGSWACGSCVALRPRYSGERRVSWKSSRVIVVRRTEHRWRELEMMKKGCVLCSIYGFYQRSMPNNAVEIRKHHSHAIAPARCERTDVHTIPKCRSCLRPKGHGKYPERRASPSCMNTKGLLLGIPL